MKKILENVISLMVFAGAVYLVIRIVHTQDALGGLILGFIAGYGLTQFAEAQKKRKGSNDNLL